MIFSPALKPRAIFLRKSPNQRVARPVRPPRCAIGETIIHAANTTTTLFTAAVFIYCSLNFLMYQRMRREIEKQRRLKDTLEHALKKDKEVKRKKLEHREGEQRFLNKEINDKGPQPQYLPERQGSEPRR